VQKEETKPVVFRTIDQLTGRGFLFPRIHLLLQCNCSRGSSGYRTLTPSELRYVTTSHLKSWSCPGRWTGHSGWLLAFPDISHISADTEKCVEQSIAWEPDNPGFRICHLLPCVNNFSCSV
jgi:hypothetical protein